jgi:hypothetical protein
MTTAPIDFKIFEEHQSNHGTWTMIPVLSSMAPDTKIAVMRLNALGSLFYFSKVILRNRRLIEHFHLDICLNIEREHLKEILEVPRDHFKSTICSESAPIWWALPFTDRDEALMRHLGYGDEWIRWMRRAHNQDTRTLLVSENITNAAKLGVRIDGHYKNNDLFRTVFPEVVIDSGCSWTQFSKTHKRSAGAKPHGEGTYDYLGVGGALQSRHYDRVVQDDLVGKAAVESESIMDKTIDYHKLLVGAFDSDRAQLLDNDEIVVGNRWSWKDLNSYIRAEEPYFRVTNHSAWGGCCSEHPEGTPIFPEEFSMEKLLRFQKRLGLYLFSCQFLNKPIPPEELEWSVKDIRFFDWKRENVNDEGIGRVLVRHEVVEGEVILDLPVSLLEIKMIVDPNHNGEEGRCNHAIIVVGRQRGDSKESERIYLLDCWAESAGYDIFIDKIYKLAEKWRLTRFFLETVAAQKYLKYHLEFRNRIEGRTLKVDELKTPRTKDAKMARIKALGPIFQNRQFWCMRSHSKFIEEFSLFPNGKYRDILDTLGYAHEVFTRSSWSNSELATFYQNYQPQVGMGKCGY